MSYQLLALDIDGTIVKEDTNTPTKRVYDAIQKANKKIHICLVTARAWEDQKVMIDHLNLKNFYHVIENGSRLITPEGKEEFHHYISKPEANLIVKTLKGLFDDLAYCVDNVWHHTCKAQNSMISLICYSRKKAEMIPNIIKGYSIAIGNHWENPNWAVAIISHKNASKGKGLNYIQKKANISPEETIAVGDGATDISMMEYAGLKVAMGNAEQKLKNIANCFVSSVSDNGLVELIEKYII